MKQRLLLALLFCLAVPLVLALCAEVVQSLPLIIKAWQTPSLLFTVMTSSGALWRILLLTALLVIIVAVATVLSLKARTLASNLGVTLVSLVVSALLLSGLLMGAYRMASVLSFMDTSQGPAHFVVNLMTHPDSQITFPVSFCIWLIGSTVAGQIGSSRKPAPGGA